MSHEIISKKTTIGVIGPSNEKLISIISCKDNKCKENEKVHNSKKHNFSNRALVFSLLAFRPIISRR